MSGELIGLLILLVIFVPAVVAALRAWANGTNRGSDYERGRGHGL